MNAPTFERCPAPNHPSATTPTATAPIRRVHRQRDFGVGYGNSSGYASPRRYADHRSRPLFRCA